MLLNITKQNNLFSTSPQLTPINMVEIASLGYKTISNNRPDGEVVDQPLNDTLHEAASKEGLNYEYLPIISGQIREDQIIKLYEIYKTSPSPILAFCRSGARSESLFQIITTPEIIEKILKK